MILEDMYSEKFYHFETVVPTSPEYHKAVIACEKLMEQLSQRLSKRIMSWCRNSGRRQQSPNVSKAKPFQVWFFCRADCPAGSP